MIKVNGKEWKSLKEEEKIAYCESLLEDSKQAMQKPHLEWYFNYRFQDGDHYLSYNAVTNSLIPTPRKRGEVRLVVNKVRSSIRAIQNYATSTKPKWEITPGDLDDETIKRARRMGKVMDYIYRKLKLEGMVSGVIDSGLNTSVGWVEVDWDDKAENGLGQVRVRLHDPFDVWVDRRAYLYAGRVVGRWMAKTTVKSLDEIMNDERYGKKARIDVKPDEELAVSELKQKILRKELGADEKAVKRGTVKEFYLWDDDKNEKGGHVKLFTYAGGKQLVEEDLKDREFPILCYQITMNPLKIYQRSWTADAVPLNKALDRALSQKIMWVNQALVWRIIAEKGHGVSQVTNEIGDILEINKGREFKTWETPTLPNGFDRLNDELSSYIEDTLGAHDAALGRLPSGARSGKTLEALQAADANNLSGITQSLESFLSVVGERVLDIVAEKYVTSRIAKIADPEEGSEYMKVIGEGAPEEVKTDDATIITGDNEVIVKIGSWLGYTKEAQLDTVMRLAEAGVLPAEEVLRQLEFPNVEELSEKARSQRLEQHEMDLAVAGHAQGQQGGAGQAQEDPMLDMADEENTAMMNGQMVPPTEGATPEHTQAHMDFVNSRTFQAAAGNPQIVKIFQQHIQGEMQG